MSMKPNPKKIRKLIKDHNYFCDCAPQWRSGKHGQELVCVRDGALLWWPTPDMSKLKRSQKMALHVSAAMEYDVDGDTIDSMLLELGHKKIGKSNFDDAMKSLRAALERRLWKDNSVKQVRGY